LEEGGPVPPLFFMGLFSTDRTAISASVTKLYEASPNRISETVLSSVLTNSGISTDLTKSVLYSVGEKTESAFRYAKKSYTYGLPNPKNSSSKVSSGNRDAVESVLTDYLGNRVIVKACMLGRPDADFLAREYLLSVGWDEETNVVSNPPFTVPPLAGDVRLWLTAIEGTNKVRVMYRYVWIVAIYVEKYITVDVNPNSIYYHAIYQNTDNAGVPVGDDVYWMHDTASEEFPLLSIGETLYSVDEYYPFIPLRHKGVNMSDASLKSTELYKTSNRLLSLLGINMDSMNGTIHENDEIADQDNAYVLFGCQLHSDTKIAKQYQYDYFVALGAGARAQKGDYEAWEESLRTATPPYNYIEIEDGSVNMRLSFKYIDINTVVGEIGEIGEITRQTIVRSPVKELFFSHDRSSIIYRKQVTAAAYIEMTVYGLFHEYQGAGATDYSSSIESSFNATQGNDPFILPINRSIVQYLSLEQKNELMYESLLLVFVTDVEYTIEWYQTTAFKIVVVIAAIVLAVYSIAFAIESAKLMYAGFIAKGMTVVEAIIVTAFVMVGTQLAIQVGGRFVIDFLGLKGTVAAQIVITMIAIYTIFTKGFEGFKGLPGGEEFLLLTSATLGSGIKGEIKTQNDALAKETKDLQDQLKEDFEELDEMFDLLNTRNDMIVDMYSKPKDILVISESPTDFYNRTIHIGNIGTLSLSVIEQYVDSTLTLPKPQNTIF
jgi:hypothetical protein